MVALRVAAPALERGRRPDLGRNSLGVERVNGLVVDQHVLAARLVLELGNTFLQLPVVEEKWSLGCQLAGDQALAQENFARGRRVDRPKGNAPPRHQREPVT